MVDSPNADALRRLLERVTEALDLGASVDIADDGETVVGTVEGKDLGLFIGHHGQIRDAGCSRARLRAR